MNENAALPVLDLSKAPTCLNCKFSAMRVHPDGLIFCRRNPPRTDAMLVGINEETKQPDFASVLVEQLTQPGGWCGEHHRRAELPAVKAPGRR